MQDFQINTLNPEIIYPWSVFAGPLKTLCWPYHEISEVQSSEVSLLGPLKSLSGHPWSLTFQRSTNLFLPSSKIPDRENPTLDHENPALFFFIFLIWRVLGPEVVHVAFTQVLSTFNNISWFLIFYAFHVEIYTIYDFSTPSIIPAFWRL